MREGAGEDAARHLAGLKKQAMAARAEQVLAAKSWLPELLRPAAWTRYQTHGELRTAWLSVTLPQTQSGLPPRRLFAFDHVFVSGILGKVSHRLSA